MMYDVAVIGAGISGLTAARELVAAGHSVIVLERQQHTGGNAISENIGGFLMEHGPTTLNAMVPEALALTKELGLDAEFIGMGEGVKKRYLYANGRLHGISVRPTGFLLSRYLSVSARLSIICEIFRAQKTTNEEETVHAFATRRFGQEFADKVMEPMAAGIFAGDAKKLSVQSVFPRLVEMEKQQGSITRAVMKAGKGSEPGKRLFSFKQGVGTLPKTIANLLGERVCCGVAVNSISHSVSGYRIETSGAGVVVAGAVVVATQPHVASDLLEKLDPVSANAASQIEAPPMSVIYLGYAREQVKHPLDSLGFLSIKGETGVLTGAQFSSTLFDGRAPNGYIAVAGYVGGTRNPDAARIPAEQLIPQVHEEFAQLLGIRGEPVLQRCRHWAMGLPQYDMAHGKKKLVLLATNQRTGGIFLTGNYLSGVSIANCIAQAKNTAKQAHLFLSKKEVSSSYKSG